MTRTLHQKFLERETGIEPATNSLEGCDSTTELLPPRLSQAGGLRPARPPTRSLAGPQDPRSARAAHSLRSFAVLRAPDSLGTLDGVSDAACHERAAQRRVEWWRGEDS